MRRARCPLCDATPQRPRRTLGHREVVHCLACGFEFAAAWDGDALAREYRNAYYLDPDDPRIETWARQHAGVWDELVALLERNAPAITSLLDVGAGTGGFLQRVRVAHPGWQLAAIEAEPAAREALRRRLPDLGLPVETAAELQTHRDRWDCIALLQTLEHLSEPGPVLRGIRRNLADDGVLLLTVPNRRALGVTVRGYRAACYANNTHLQFFDRDSVERLLQAAGFARWQRVADRGRGGVVAIVRHLLRRFGRSSELRYLAWPTV